MRHASSGQQARLGRRRRRVAADRLREAVAEVELRDEILGAPEAGVVEVVLERPEGAVRCEELERLRRGRSRGQPFSPAIARAVRSFRACHSSG